MDKRTILVTGAGSGFGKGAAVELAARGHAVIATTETAEQADALRSEHPELTTMKLDVTNDEDVERVGELEVDVLINNAGMGVMGPMATVPMEKVRAIFDVNVFGMVELTQAVVPGMIERGSGRIINVSSLSGKRVRNSNAAYAMTKFAVMALTHATRQTGWEDGVRVTALCPSFVATDLTAEVVKVSRAEMIAPDDLAEVAAMLIALPNTAAIAEVLVNCRLEDTL